MRLLSAAGAVIILLGLSQTEAKEKTPPPPKPATAPVTTDCSADIPFGQPTVPGPIKTFCKTGYQSYYDTHYKVPRLVTYPETADETFGCLGRYKSFHIEKSLPPDERASEEDYRNSGYDVGHNDPDDDNATTIDRLYDTFDFVNTAPQLPGYNEQGWESLEQDVRDWAWKRGQVVVYVGSIFNSTSPKTIGKHQVAVPDAFYKIVIDPKTKDTLAFIMPHVDTPKGDMSRFEVSISEVESKSGLTFPLPAGVDKAAKPAMWPIDNSGWEHQHQSLCHTN